ncbi:MAG: AAA-like domain-containing protein [Blastocatellia bacterium]|nr:AAA-like domain-containing protein [Blastocatellia bacterium]
MPLAYHQPDFYVVGGTLHHDAPCYVYREADRELMESLLNGEFCYVLTPRQMGKSSLMIRTASRLLDLGSGVVILDLTAAGQNLTVEQWYGGLLMQVGQQLDLEDDLLDYWQERSMLSPLQRWMNAIREIVLPRAERRLVIFVDEIDAVRSLPFSTDEFFAGIREFYNRRSQDKELAALTFCLMGVATPSDLIRDTNTTPFNIGKRIELLDFTSREAASLAQGLRRNEELSNWLLRRILYWTNGHPYLTQHLCRTVADRPEIRREVDVDRVVDDLFFSLRGRERDDNLLFVRDRLLRGEKDLASLLNLYARVWRNEPVRAIGKESNANPLLNTLQLSGITRVENGALVVRNRIYAQVFDQNWVLANLPRDEILRQKRAFRRTAFLVGAIMATIVLAIATPMLIAYREARFAAQEETARRHLLYSTHMNLAGQAWATANINQLHELVNAHLPVAGQKDLRQFEWFYNWRLLHRDRLSLMHEEAAVAIAFSPDDRVIATAGGDRQIRLWDSTDGSLLASLPGHTQLIWEIAFSPDGTMLASSSWDRTVRFWDLATRREIGRLQGHTDNVTGIAFSPDGKTLASAGWDKQVKLWDLSTGQEKMTLAGAENWVWSVAFSPNGKLVAAASEDKTIRLWDAATGRLLRTIEAFERSVYGIAFSHDGVKLAGCSENGQTRIFQVATGKDLGTLDTRSFAVSTVAFSPDDKRIATAGIDRIIRLWDAASMKLIREVKGHAEGIRAIRFSHDGRTIATAADDQTVKLWDVADLDREDVLRLPAGGVESLQISPDDRMIVYASGETLFLWNVAAQKQERKRETAAPIRRISLSPDGQTIAAAHQDRSVSFWETATLTPIGSLKKQNNLIYALEFSPDGALLATGDRDHLVKLWNWRSNREVATLSGHERGVKSIAFSPDGRLLASGSDDRTVKIWDLQSRRTIQTLPRHANEVWAVAFSPDGRVLATAGNDRTIRIFDRKTWGQTQTLMGHSAGIRTLGFSTDSARLASGSDDHTVKLWAPATGHELMTFSDHQDRITGTLFSNHAALLLSSSRDGAIRFRRAADRNEVEAHLSKHPRR